MSVFVDVVNAVNTLSNDISHFFTVEIFVFFKNLFPEILKWAELSFIRIHNFSIGFLSVFVTDFLYSLTVFQQVEDAFSALDSQTLILISFFRIPEAVHIILSAYFSRFVLRLVGVL
jgi:hypothetical protein